MNKIIRLGTFVVFFALPVVWLPVQAQTSKSTVDFLTKLNGYYYCLTKTGVSNYTCDVTCSLSAKTATQLMAKNLYDAKLWKTLENFHFSVIDVSGAPISLMGTEPPKLGNVVMDDKVASLNYNVMKTAQTFFQFWKALVVEPLNDPTDINQGNLKFIRTNDGFKVYQEDPSGGIMTGMFDKKGKLLELNSESGKDKTIIQPAFVNSARGYLLRGLRIVGPGIGQTCVIEYGVEGKYWMPKTLSIQILLPEITKSYIELLYNITNYQINK